MKKESNKSIVWLVIGLVIIIIGLFSYIAYDMMMDNKAADNKAVDNNKDTSSEKVDNSDESKANIEVKSKYDTEKFYLENLSKNGYGFAKVYYDDHIDIVQLNKTGENKTIMSFERKSENSVWNEPFHMQIVGNKFNFEIQYATSFQEGNGWQNKNTRLYSIDLNTLNISEILDSNTFELTYDEYALSDKYIFIPRTQDSSSTMEYKIFRYDLKTLEETVINDQLKAEELFVYNSKLYLKCFNDNYKNIEFENKEKIDLSNRYNYFSIDFDGNNIIAYKEEEYNNIKNTANIVFEGFNSDKDMYFYYNDKKIYINDNKLLYDNEVLYTVTGNNRFIELYYTDDNGYVAIRDYEVIDNVAVGEEKYYIINLKTKEIKEVSENEVHKFYQVLY